MVDMHSSPVRGGYFKAALACLAATALTLPLPVRGGYFKAALACLAATALTLPLRDAVDAANIVMIFLLVVALVAVRLGSGPAILAAFGGVALFDFFFVPPHFSMAVADAQYLITFAVMLAVALVIGQLAARLREKALLAAQREEEMRALYDMAKELSGAIAAEQVADIVRGFLSRRLATGGRPLCPARR
jgi:two-component system sensor histidine kinase KdpD